MLQTKKELNKTLKTNPAMLNLVVLEKLEEEVSISTVCKNLIINLNDMKNSKNYLYYYSTLYFCPCQLNLHKKATVCN